MGRLCVAAVECDYQVDTQLKEQFIDGLNDKYMLEEIIKELTATKNDDHITSGCVLAWAKRVEAHRAQAAVLNTLIESKQFDKIKISKKAKNDKSRAPVHQSHSDNHTDTLGRSTSQGSAQHTAGCVQSVAK